MSGIAGFVQAYIKPSRWWRRGKKIELTVWPRWIAQRLCPHIHKQLVMYSVEEKTRTMQCLDCHDQITENNNCVHPEVSWGSWETIKSTPIPTSFRCEACGVQLFNKDLPKDVNILPPPYKA